MSKIYRILSRNNYFLFDVYIFLSLFTYGIQVLATSLLLQDKICRLRFNQTKYFCQHINEDIFVGSDQIHKDQILASAALFNNYGNLIQAIPMFIWSLFFGSFLDRQPGATRMIFSWISALSILTSGFYLINIFYFSIDPYYLLLTGITAYLTGGMATFLTVTHRFMIINTDPDYRSLRFTVFQIYLVVAVSLGSLLGGHLIWLETDDEQQQRLRNYHLSMWIALAIYCGLFIMILVIRIDRDEKLIDSAAQIDESNPEINIERYPSENSMDIVVAKNHHPSSINYVCRQFFDLENVRQTYRCLIEPRMNQIREQILLLIILLFMQFLNSYGMDSMFLQFAQKVYQFDSKTYSNVYTLSKVIPSLGLLIGSNVLINRLKWKDGTILALTFSTGFLSQLLIGTFPKPIVYLIALVIGSISGLSTIVMKTKISKLIPKDQVGKIFSVISTIESLVPFLGTLIFSTIFSASVSTYPTLIYHVSAFITLIGLILALFQDLYFN